MRIRTPRGPIVIDSDVLAPTSFPAPAQHQREHNADRWIAATAIRLGVPLVSNDGIFKNVPGLLLETANGEPTPATDMAPYGDWPEPTKITQVAIPTPGARWVDLPRQLWNEPAAPLIASLACPRPGDPGALRPEPGRCI